MQYDKAYHFLMPKLEKELPPEILYHNAAHTKHVIQSAILLGQSEKLSDSDMLLLKTAALFHDAGFLIQSDNHEEHSCEVAREYLPGFDYDKKQIDAICEMIMATKLPQAPQGFMAGILCDADLFYMGEDNYEENAENLYTEKINTGAAITREQWKQTQIDFLSSHKYFTATAQEILNKKKELTLEKLQSKSMDPSHKKTKENPWLIVQDAILIIIGSLIAAIALKLFLVPNHFFDGGITGMSLLLHEHYHWNLGLVIFCLNLPLIIISYFSVGKRFALGTLCAVILLGIFLLLIDSQAATCDKLLISIFGGAFLGIGIGLVMRTGSALDGIEVLAVYTLKRTSFSIAEIILGINLVIFTIAGFLYGLDKALYSVLTYFVATRCIDYVVEGLQAYTGVTIVSSHSEEMKHELVNNLGRGITIYKGERGFLPGNFEISSDCDIIYTVITRLELRKLKNLVYEVDPSAFVFANTIKEASGGILKRRRSH